VVPALRVYGWMHRGTTVECPICGGRLRKFAPYGHRRRRSNALCPKCLSLERHRLLWLFLRERTDFFSGRLQVLHIAPERCFVKRFEEQHDRGYVTADLGSSEARVQMDVQAIPFDDESFDVVLCNHVLEHVDDDRRAMRELQRVLRPRGWAILQSPVDPSLDDTYEDPGITSPAERQRAFGQHDHVRTYGMDYGKRLAESGFRVSEDGFVQTLPDEVVSRHALPRDEVVFFCRK
jgi:SAM-dependent methyltransferase